MKDVAAMGMALGRKHASPHELRVDLLVVTIERLRQRIEARLPGRNLALLAVALREIAQRAAERSAKFRKPHLPLRLLSAGLVLGIGAALIYAKSMLRFNDVNGWDLLQGLDAAGIERAIAHRFAAILSAPRPGLKVAA